MLIELSGPAEFVLVGERYKRKKQKKRNLMSDLYTIR